MHGLAQASHVLATLLDRRQHAFASDAIRKAAH
jgi:hypothetical protein